MRIRLLVLGAMLVAGATAAGATAAKGGPAPDPLLGWDGVTAPGGAMRCVALAASGRTTVAAVRIRDGRVLRYGPVPGELGIPQVAWDGTSDGVSADGRRLVLASISGRQAPTRTTFAVLQAATLRVVRTIRLPGLWAFDAISPDGATIYALRYGSADDPAHYSVRAIEAATGRILPGAIVDRREPDEEMQGSPVTRAWNPGRAWAFTLYAKPNGTAFVHGLDTTRHQAFCFELPWQGVGEAIGSVELRVTLDGRTLTLSQPGRPRLASIDLASFVVRSFRSPA